MLTTPHRYVYPGDVAPGRWIEHERTPMLVDEVRRTADGWTIYARPSHRSTSGKRSVIEYRDGIADVKLLPNDREREQLAEALVHKLGSMRLSVGDVATPAAVWTLEPDVGWRDSWPAPPEESAAAVDKDEVRCEPTE